MIQRIRDGIRDFYPGYFALVMATGIVSLASYFQGTELTGWGILMEWIAWVLFIINVPIYIVLWIITLLRFINYPNRQLSDLTSHTVGPTFLTTVAGTCVLGIQFVVLGQNQMIALGLWYLALLLWLVLIYTFFTSVTVHETKPPLAEGLNGAWLLVVVSTQSISVLGTQLAPRFGDDSGVVLFLTLCFYLLGCMFYLLIITLIFYRFTFMEIVADDLKPPYWINMGAVAITTMAGVRLIQTTDWQLSQDVLPFLRGFTLFFWATATWWIPLLIILGDWRHLVKHIPLTYHPAYWAMVFPLGMYTAATFQLAVTLQQEFLLIIPRIFVFIAIGAWLAAFVGMVWHYGRSMMAGPSQSPN